MACKWQTKTNGKDSILAQQLANEFTVNNVELQELVDSMYNTIYTENFQTFFGDFVKDAKEGSPQEGITDENGEPKLFIDGNDWYFLNKEDNKFYINGKFVAFTPKQVNEITQNLAFNLYQEIADQGFITRESFENYKNENNLYSILDDFIDNSLQEAIDNNDLETAKTYLYIKLDKEEFYKEVDMFFESRGISIQEEPTKEEEQSTDEVVKRETYEVDPRDKATFNIRLLLSFIPELVENNEGGYDVKQGEFGYKFINSTEIWNFLVPKLSGFSSTYNGGDTVHSVLDKMMNVIRDYSDNKPYLNALYQFIQETDTNTKFQFEQAFDNEYANFTSILFNKGKESSTYRIFNSQVSSPSDKLMALWGNNLFNSDLVKNNKVDLKLLNRYTEALKDIKDTYLKDRDEDKAFSRIKTALSKVGIELNERALIDYGNSPQRLVNDLTRLFTDSLKKDLFDSEGNYKNVLKDQKIVRNLAALEADLEGSLTDSTVVANNKQYYEYGNVSFITDFFSRLKQGDVTQLEYLRQNHPNSLWLQELDRVANIEDSNQREEAWNKIQVRTFNSFGTEEVGDISSDSKTTKQSDFVAMNINSVLDRNLFNTLTMGDKSTVRMLEGFTNVPTNILGTIEDPTFDEGLVTIFRNYFADEYNRMYKTWDEILNLSKDQQTVYYHTDKDGYNILEDNPNTNKKGMSNGTLSWIFPELSHNKISKEFNDQLGLYDSTGKPFSKLDPDREQNLRNYIRDRIKTFITDGVKAVQEEGITKRDISSTALDSEVSNQYLRAVGHYVINQQIANIEQTKTIYGDPAYFRDFVEVNKRAQMANIDGLRLSLGRTKEDHIFNSSVINNQEIQSVYYEELENSFGDNQDVQAYKNVNRTDAQGYISHKRWKFLLERLGRWEPSYDNIYKKITDGFEELRQGKPISDSNKLTLGEFKDFSAQPLKGVYYGLVNGKPTYIKYSQGILLPQLVENTKIQPLLEKMMLDGEGNELSFKDHISEVITLDGVKVGAGVPDVITDNGIDINNTELTPIRLDNRNWRLQQDLPYKGIRQTMIGSQIVKNILANIDLEANYNGRTGKQIIDDINSYISTLSNTEANKIRFILGLDKGNFNKSKLDNIVLEELNRRGSDRNITEAIRKSRDTGEIIYEALPQHLRKINNLVFSYVNKRTVDLTTNGGALIQMSSFGFEKLTASEEQGIYWLTDNKDTIEKGPKPPTKDKPGEVLISGGFLTKYIPNWREVPRDQLMEIIDEKIFDIVGYRIPNQGLSSNDNLRVVGILPDIMGDTIVPYSEITTKTGSDFDIDKMYVMMPEFQIRYTKKAYKTARAFIKNELQLDKEGLTLELQEEGVTNTDGLSTYELENLYIENVLFEGDNEIAQEYSELLGEGDVEYIDYATEGIKGVKNQLIQAYLDILNAPQNYDEKMSPLDADYLKDSIYDLMALKRGITRDQFQSKQDFENFLQGSSLNFYDPVNQTRIKYRYMGGKAGVGQTANHVVDVPLSQISELLLATTDELMAIGNSNNEFLNLFGEYDFNNEYRITKTLSAFLNAYVDIAKDPYIALGNHNTFTANVAFLLIRAGLPINNVNAFLMQDSVIDLVRETNLQDSKIADNIDKAKPLNEIIDRLGFDFEAYKDISTIDINNLSELQDQLQNSDNLTQLRILKTFTTLKDSAKELNDSVKATKQDTNGAGNDVASLWSSDNLFKQVLANPNLLHFREKFVSDEVPTFMGTFYKNSIDLVNEITNKIFPRIVEQKPFIEDFSKKIGKYPITDDTLLRTLVGDTYTQIYHEIPVLYEDNPLRLFTELPNQVYKLRQELDNPFLNQLEFSFGEDFSFMGINQIRKGTEYFNELMYRGWLDLFNTNYQIANDLVKYAFYSTGFKQRFSSITPYIPHEWLYSSGFARQMQEIEEYPIGVFSTSTTRNILRQNSNNRRYTPYIRVNNMLKGVKGISPGKAFKLNKDKHFNYTIPTDNKAIIYKPFVNTDKGLMAHIGNDKNDNGIYIRVKSLGTSNKGNKIYEFNTTNIESNDQTNSKGETLIPTREEVQSIIRTERLTRPQVQLTDLSKYELFNTLPTPVAESSLDTTKFNVEVYDKIDKDSYSISIDYDNRRYSLVLDRDGEIVDPTYYDPNKLKDINSKITLSKEEVFQIFNEIENTIEEYSEEGEKSSTKLKDLPRTELDKYIITISETNEVLRQNQIDKITELINIEYPVYKFSEEDLKNKQYEFAINLLKSKGYSLDESGYMFTKGGIKAQEIEVIINQSQEIEEGTVEELNQYKDNTKKDIESAPIDNSIKEELLKELDSANTFNKVGEIINKFCNL